MRNMTDKQRTFTTPFKEGDSVMLSTKYIKLKYKKGCPKLLPRFLGPFEITQVINRNAFKLALPHTMNIHPVFHASLLKPFKSRHGEQFHPQPIVVEDEEEFEIEIILDMKETSRRTKKTKHSGKKRQVVRKYLVRWKGYGPEYDEWIDEQELQRNCKRLIKEFHARHPGKV